MLRWTTLRPIVLAALALAALGALLGPLGALGFIKSGLFDVAAARPHTKLTQWVTEQTMIHSIRRHASGIRAPASVTATQVAAGFCAYETHCVACHGAAAVPRQPWVSGLEPAPPYLLDAAERWRPRELFWIVKNGIKMTGMPAWGNAMSDAEIWSLVAWLEASRQLPPQTYVRWRSEGRCGGATRPPARGPLAIPPRAPALPTAATGGSAPSGRGAARP